MWARMAGVVTMTRKRKILAWRIALFQGVPIAVVGVVVDDIVVGMGGAFMVGAAIAAMAVRSSFERGFE